MAKFKKRVIKRLYTPSFPSWPRRVWREDGNVVLQADTTAFRVDAGVLIHQSPIFADLLSETVLKSQQTYQSCPIVVLSDSSYDLEHFLKAVFDPRYVTTDDDSDLEVAVLTAILHLSTKYVIPHLRRQAIRSLRTNYFPSSLALWDALNLPNPPRRHTITEVVNIANCASETRVPVILVPALTICSALGIDQIIDGVENASPDDTDQAQLTPHLQRLLLQARPQLQHLALSKTLGWLYGHGHPCAQKCAAAKSRAARSLLDGTRPKQSVWFPLSIFDVSEIVDEDMCQLCVDDFNTSILPRRQEAWDQLPSIFGYESWEALTRMADSDELGSDISKPNPSRI
ncbi:hypothetical protein BXZ70DRAFT_1006645 [Cristinia sonorae]|uniref:BTB domain-containing protein n=1 Tax=Cristinia sonorae TaxID=1940300 RepID=A0A8K0UUE5_9AGAR|nr:hypothetical protein BXZ70DRAFT_1006645 [Cristinia sonorae]